VGQRLVCREVAGPVDTAMLQSLEEARRQGDFLVVAVTAGAQGDSDQRLLAALGCVDASVASIPSPRPNGPGLSS